MPLGMMDIVATGFNLWIQAPACRKCRRHGRLLFKMTRAYGTFVFGVGTLHRDESRCYHINRT
jgi:hypothetical protein